MLVDPSGILVDGGPDPRVDAISAANSPRGDSHLLVHNSDEKVVKGTVSQNWKGLKVADLPRLGHTSPAV
jgi:hypothetical protein